MSEINRICVYCGSGPGTDPAFVAAARAFGKILAENSVGLVYGGGQIGVMGAIADATRSHGGDVIGVIPRFLMRREHADPGRDKLIVTEDMHERKRKMFELADAFVAFPGGIGTLEELVEQLTWIQLGRHGKPVLLANIKGFWNPLCALIDHMKSLQFIRSGLDFEMLVAERVDDVLPKLRTALAGVPESDKKLATMRTDQL